MDKAIKYCSICSPRITKKCPHKKPRVAVKEIEKLESRLSKVEKAIEILTRALSYDQFPLD